MTTEALAHVAAVTQRLAVLLDAGVAPPSAWRHIAQSVAGAVPSQVAANTENVAEALLAASRGLAPLEAQGWRGLAAAWVVATDAGAPLASSLRAYAVSLRSLAQTQRDVAVALAAPTATARMVLVLPAIGLGFGALLGFDTLRTLTTTALGWGCLVVGGALIAVARRWNRRMIARAQPRQATPGIECDLMAIAVSGGASLDRARGALSEAVRRFGLPADVDRIEAILQLASAAGVPAAELLRSEAEEIRRDAQAQAQHAAAALSVRLMLPLGLCILPAFIALGVVPLILSVISSTVASF